MSAFDFRAPAVAPSSRFEAEITRVILNILSGKLNATGDITLTASAASTTLTDPRLTAYSVVLFMPQTDNAARAFNTMYVPRSTQKRGSAVINHASDAAADKTFAYLVIG